MIIVSLVTRRPLGTLPIEVKKQSDEERKKEKNPRLYNNNRLEVAVEKLHWGLRIFTGSEKEDLVTVINFPQRTYNICDCVLK